ncbi:YaaL family protein [Bacillus carboniphilus]|uniref:YaaL family protein n=1 Tax=Bacillus carboniphilus TaxID=86663 RepID=A0ABY9JR88_9BACI|nr:YaaL family protein [Bacillus carboniphilus]WLR41906.1 YaaL family protein [Bacillus carboniphilus]
MISFNKKRKLRKEYDGMLIDQINESKKDWAMKQKFVDHSLDPSMELINEMNIAEAKYYFLLKEAKYRNIKTILGR